MKNRLRLLKSIHAIQNVDLLGLFFFLLAYVFKLQLSVSALLSPTISFLSQLCEFGRKITMLTGITWDAMVKRVQRMSGLNQSGVSGPLIASAF